MKPTLAERAAKIREDFGDITLTTIQENRQFFDDVWHFCEAVMNESRQSTTQFVPPQSMNVAGKM